MVGCCGARTFNFILPARMQAGRPWLRGRQRALTAALSAIAMGALTAGSTAPAAPTRRATVGTSRSTHLSAGALMPLAAGAPRAAGRFPTAVPRAAGPTAPAPQADSLQPWVSFRRSEVDGGGRGSRSGCRCCASPMASSRPERSRPRAAAHTEAHSATGRKTWELFSTPSTTSFRLSLLREPNGQQPPRQGLRLQPQGRAGRSQGLRLQPQGRRQRRLASAGWRAAGGVLLREASAGGALTV